MSSPTHGPERWHPKITPYRLLVLSFGIGLGAAKAWETSRGEQIASITLEWISGVVVSLSVFILSWYDTGAYTSAPTSLLFSYDCLDILWRILDNMHIPKPNYRSDERINVLSYSHHLPITGYRLCVSATVIIFGSTKMLLSCMGWKAAANTMDWIYAVVMGTSLYFLGLYENNTGNVLPALFTKDYSDHLRREGIVFLYSRIAYILAVAANISYLVLWAWGFFQVAISYLAFGETSNLLQKLIAHPSEVFMGLVFLILALIPIPPFVYLLWTTSVEVMQ